jgi:hypothetical protein
VQKKAALTLQQLPFSAFTAGLRAGPSPFKKSARTQALIICAALAGGSGGADTCPF